ncbi:lipooligosaccharide transport system ATP-binding protein [Stackebrandtia endophytica]|uniref:Lipooligosaccharide transport system ATP-binding protein n=1 Tax=Stackebrandtia endophytica TaxID=1496996 RepID=A0A543B2G2_9ACTN|nr:ATP-binding cassette domain-containing protein [Stackebrandtia endophytica]TQL79015.1 lipooligosaccharide transport system ATP-binding protein [Stackebrandtia endophytica]
MSVDPPLIHAHNLVKRYGDFVAVAGIDLSVKRGEAFGFLGPNGAGKSTTMRMIGCVSEPTDGELSVLGLNTVKQGADIRARLGVVPQEDTLDDEMSVFENLVIYARYFGIKYKVARERARELLEFVRLSDRADKKVEELSGGMKRRLTIARALVNEPDIIMLDEPTTGLDPQARHLVWERLFQLKQQGITIILTTHYMDEAEQLCDRLVIMDGGRIASEGSPRELIERHVTKEVVELRFNGRHTGELSDIADKLDGISGQVDPLPDRILLYSDDAETAVAEVHARGLEPSSVLERRATLEDVFLRLTGRSLIE